ncbi:MAG: host specificity protein [Chromatocurvus sp.]
MEGRQLFLAVLVCTVFSFTFYARSADTDAPAPIRDRGLIELWAAGQPAFGQYVTQMQGGAGSQEPPRYTVQTGRDLAANPLLDFAFLSLEQHYNADSARNVATGLGSGGEDAAMPLLVRIPPISVDGVDAARARVQEVLALGADGVVIPHVLSAEEARIAISLFEGVEVWSPDNPDGDVIAMLIVEDPDVFAELEEIASLPGYSALVCGIGSLTAALNGDREAADAIALEVLAVSQRAGLVDLMTVDTESVARRVEQGFLALLAYGPDSDEAIRAGRAAAGR